MVLLLTMPKTLLFDLGKVLIPFDFARAYGKMAVLSGLSAEEIRRRLSSSDLFRLFETGGIEPLSFANSVGTLVGYECEFDCFCEIWSSIFSPEPLIPEDFIASLSSRYPLFLVSNTNAIHFEMLRKSFSPLRWFKGYVLSYEVGAMKPAPEFYAAALKLANSPAEECVFIDDLAENVEGARLAGMDAIQFTGFAALKAELSARAIL
jgi:FMN phosphatase YigB (HAD superfamily)